MINEGDIVTLASGGPNMTVQYIHGLRKNKYAVCIFWKTRTHSYYDNNKLLVTNETADEEKIYTRTAALKKVA